MKKMFKKNQIIITALAVMIAVAGYLNFSDTDFGFGSRQASTESIVEDIDSLDYDITDETALLEENAGGDSGTEEPEGLETGMETPGEAVLTAGSAFAAQAKVSREQLRAQSRQELQEIIDNPDITQEEKETALNSMVELTELAEKEAAAEMLLQAQGFENAVVNLTGDSADVIVPMEEIPDEKRAQIEDIVRRKAEISPEKIVITPLGESENYD